MGKYVGEIVKGSGTHYEMFPNSTFHSAFLFPGQVSYCADSIIRARGAIGFAFLLKTNFCSSFGR